MILVKIFGSIMLVFATSMCGLNFSNCLKHRYFEIEKVVRMLKETKILMSFGHYNVFELINSLKAVDGNPCFIYEIEFFENEAFFKAWNNALANGDTGLNDEDKDLLISFGKELGSSDLDGQLMMLEMYIKIFEDRLCASKTDYSSKVKLYNSLGILSGVFLAIMLI